MSSSYAEFPDRGPMALSRYIEALGHDLSSPSRHILNQCMRAMTDRGWLPRLEEFYERLVEQGDTREALERAVTDLVYRRLLVLTPDGDRVASLLGAISIRRTPYRVALDNGVELFMTGGMELLGAAALLNQPLSVMTRCPVCDAAISFEASPEQINAVQPDGLAGYQADWDCAEPLEASAGRSRLFCSDPCLAQSDVDDDVGLPLSSALLLTVGASNVQRLGMSRFALFGFNE